MNKVNSKILVVDDNPQNIKLVITLLQSENYTLGFATDGEKALKAMEEVDYDLVLLDVMMPVLDGYETIKRIKSNYKFEHIPVIFLTAKSGEEDIVKGFELGSVDYLSKPFNQSELIARVKTHLRLKSFEDSLSDKVQEGIKEIEHLNNEFNLSQQEMIITFGEACEMRSKETGNHVRRVAEYTRLFAELCGIDDEEANILKLASTMHDIGKLSIPDNILHKPGKLDFDEFELMKTHALNGYEILKHSERDVMKVSAIVAKEHHEKYDGTGYPYGLKGDGIHIYGRIVAVADVFDALGNDRAYKKAWPMEDILELLQKEKGKHFDPILIDMLLENIESFLDIHTRLQD